MASDNGKAVLSETVRVEFERWMLEESIGDATARHPKGLYVLPEVEDQWFVWQAAWKAARIGPPSANTTAVRALCPCGAMVDWDECPYPIDRGATEFTVCCVDPDCGWCVYGATPEGAIAAWHRRTPSAETHKS